MAAKSLFIIDLEYLQSLAAVDLWLEQHKAFLQQQYAAGHFLMSGRKQPRSGGIIIATADSLAAIQQIIEQDPFHREQLARYTITEFLPGMLAEPLKYLITD